ncbi:MAG: hypothetical protein ACTTGW_01350 [Candidatus Cryptobacteroides sp.]
MKRPLTAAMILDMQHETIEPGGVWKDCVGTMSRHGVVFVWGNSGNGKTSAVMSLCRELAVFGRVLYIPLEEGYSLSLQETLRRFGMQECGTSFQVVDSCTMDELSQRLGKRRAPEFVVIDSFQYMQMSYRQYIAFKNRYPKKLLILVSHADGRQPAGRAARSVMYDAGLKIWVEGYKAFSKGRYIGNTGEAVIWDRGAREYWEGK